LDQPPHDVPSDKPARADNENAHVPMLLVFTPEITGATSWLWCEEKDYSEQNW
jgi:hypothetical protein